MNEAPTAAVAKISRGAQTVWKSKCIGKCIVGGTMTRVDERKPVNDENVEAATEEPRKGDVLGLSGSEVPKTPDPSRE